MNNQVCGFRHLTSSIHLWVLIVKERETQARVIVWDQYDIS